MMSTISKELAIDARAYRSGLGVYTRNLLRELHDTFAWPIHALSHREGLSSIAPYCSRFTVIDAQMYSLQEQLEVWRSVRQDKVLHIPHYNFPVLYRGDLLLTMHDLTHIVYPEYATRLKSRLYANPMLLAGARRASHIFTVSTYSKQKIVEHLGVDPGRITVVYNGVGKDFYPGDRTVARQFVTERFGIQKPFILYVGNLKPHKNLDVLLKAYAELISKMGRDCALVLASSDQSDAKRVIDLATHLHISLFFVSDASNTEIAELYRAAEVLVMPSFEEGFGLPVIEAMSCGTPTICANRASLPEIAGEAALYFEPLDPNQLADILGSVLESTSLRMSLAVRGIAQAAQFTWKATTERHIQVYNQFFL